MPRPMIDWRLLEWAVQYEEENLGDFPTIRELAAILHRSISVTHYHVRKLVLWGMLVDNGRVGKKRRYHVSDLARIWMGYKPRKPVS